MAITRTDTSSSIVLHLTPEGELQALHQKGCKITRGAGITLPAPSLRTALLLVQVQRASFRILQPIAATRIQQAWTEQRRSRRAKALRKRRAASVLQTAWRQHAKRRTAASTALQAAWRRHATQKRLAAQRDAAARIAAAARGRAQRLAYRRRMEEVSGPLARLQAAARGLIARRRLAAARAAARTLQTTWRRVRCMVLRRRLARAANALRHGGKLEKYRRRKGANHERHERFAWVSDDLRTFYWAPVIDRYDTDALKVRSIPMANITAVTEGVKTPLLKKMERRATEHKKRVQLQKPLALDESCAFSIVSRGRVIDFYAADPASRSAWLRDLKTALTHAHTYDQKAAMAAVQKLSEEPAKASDSDTDDD